ncbi:hypothetical protein V8J36_18520 [Frigidibacter sp. MR17.14]|uniref:hypothetical protein n=1 Tax=Frigidibacter sp. MR17.14 TaxID=3126509 RepID=UPI00301315B1
MENVSLAAAGPAFGPRHLSHRVAPQTWSRAAGWTSGWKLPAPGDPVVLTGGWIVPGLVIGAAIWTLVFLSVILP